MQTRYLVVTNATGVADDLVRRAAAQLPATAGPARRLADTAVEIPFTGPDDHRRPQVDGVDANVIAARHRQKMLLVADMDSTIISVECIDELADFAGEKPDVAQITERAMRGELDFESALNERVALLAGLPVAVLETCFEQRVRLNPGAAELVQTMNRNGAFTALVSGGFTFFTAKVATLTGFALNRANVLATAEGRLTGKVALPILGQQAKRDVLIALRNQLGLVAGQTIAVGDGANDLAMLTEAGLGVAYKAKPALRAAAGAVLDHSDLTALLAFQGYCRQRSGQWSL